MYRWGTKGNLDPVVTPAMVKVDKLKKLYYNAKVYWLLQYVGSCQEKEKEYRKLWWLELFPSSNMLVRWVVFV